MHEYVVLIPDVRGTKTKPVTAYREVKIGKTLYRVTSVFTGEKELGATLEKLAAQRVLDAMDGNIKTALQNCSHGMQ